MHRDHYIVRMAVFWGCIPDTCVQDAYTYTHTRTHTIHVALMVHLFCMKLVALGGMSCSHTYSDPVLQMQEAVVKQVNCVLMIS